jgi:hypothetical protein
MFVCVQVMSVGSKVNTFRVPGVEQNAFFLKDLKNVCCCCVQAVEPLLMVAVMWLCGGVRAGTSHSHARVGML